MATARRRTTTPYNPATGGINPVTGSPWIGGYLNEPTDPNAPPPTTPTTPTPPTGSPTPAPSRYGAPRSFDPNDPPDQTTGQGLIEKGPEAGPAPPVPPTTGRTPPSTDPSFVQYGGGLFEGPNNQWGMDKSGAPLEGFPQWDTATSLKYRFGREVAKYAPTAENAQRVIQDAIANGWDIRPDDRDQTMFWFNNPEMGDWEAVRLLSGNNTWQFNWGSDATGGNRSAATGAPSTTTSTDTGPFPPPQTLPPGTTTAGNDPPWAPTTPPTTLGTSFGNDTRAYTEDPTQAAMRDALLKLLNQPEITAESLQNDPAVRAQRIQAQRAEERQRGQMAEQNAFEGYADSGAEQTDLAGIRQQRSESEAAFIGQLAIQQMQARRADILQGIQIATQQGQFKMGQDLARELAALNAALTREQIKATLGDNAAARELQARLAHNQLTQQDKQFLLSLGFSYDQLEVTGNANATGPLTN